MVVKVNTTVRVAMGYSTDQFVASMLIGQWAAPAHILFALSSHLCQQQLCYKLHDHANADEQRSKAAAGFGIGMFSYRRGIMFDPPP